MHGVYLEPHFLQRCSLHIGGIPSVPSVYRSEGEPRGNDGTVTISGDKGLAVAFFNRTTISAQVLFMAVLDPVYGWTKCTGSWAQCGIFFVFANFSSSK